MTTSNDKLRDQINRSGEFALLRGVHPDGTGDPRGVNPTVNYDGMPTTNSNSTGRTKHQLGGYGGIPGVDVEKDYSPSEYPFCQTQETLAGHVIELDDTRGQERLLIKHSTGSGVEMRADGTIIISTTHNQITVVNGDKTIRVEGDAKMLYGGNLDVEVAGDYNLNVKGNFNTAVQGDIIETSENKTAVTTNLTDRASGHRSTTSLKSHTDMTLGDRDTIVKGNHDMVATGTMTTASTGILKLSSEDKIIGAAGARVQFGAPKINIFGASGTIGGEEVVHYGSTFHGDLNGLAKEASESYHQNYPDGSAAPSSYFPSVGSPNWDDPTNNKTTFQPTAAGMTSLGAAAIYGINDVKVDEGDFLKDAIDRTTKTDGVAAGTQSVSQVRSSLKDEKNLNNETYVANAIAEGTLNPE